ncbi:tc3a_0 protein [Trichonephila clavipes]|nr:tc3a_0 protein [Trichonephila clavipes]
MSTNFYEVNTFPNRKQRFRRKWNGFKKTWKAWLNDSRFTKPDDEAHFWLNGYVNKQNCRIWGEANPQVYVETQLHPEKLTVWCALWAGGILLQKR